MTNNYYYNLLGKEEQKIYYAIRTGLESLAASIEVPMTDGKTLADVYFLVRLDHPEIFYTVSFKYRYYQGASHMELLPEYIFPKNKIPEHRQAMQARIRKLARQAEKLDEKGKEQFIHDFICTNITYDKLKKPYSHEIIGALGHGVGVCEGIAKSVKVLCDEMGIWCIIALSDANPAKGIKYRHTWNVLKIGGKYYHLDATFDNSLGKGSIAENIIRYDYFNLADEQFFRDHEPVIYKIPACTDKAHTYYQEKKISFTKTEDVRKRCAQAAKKNKPFLFQWRGGYLTKEMLTELLEIIGQESNGKGKQCAISLNWPQSVLLVKFSPLENSEKTGVSDENLQNRTDQPENGFILEEANEGEKYDVPDA